MNLTIYIYSVILYYPLKYFKIVVYLHISQIKETLIIKNAHKDRIYDRKNGLWGLFSPMEPSEWRGVFSSFLRFLLVKAENTAAIVNQMHETVHNIYCLSISLIFGSLVWPRTSQIKQKNDFHEFSWKSRIRASERELE